MKPRSKELGILVILILLVVASALKILMCTREPTYKTPVDSSASMEFSASAWGL